MTTAKIICLRAWLVSVVALLLYTLIFHYLDLLPSTFTKPLIGYNIRNLLILSFMTPKLVHFILPTLMNDQDLNYHRILKFWISTV